MSTTLLAATVKPVIVAIDETHYLSDETRVKTGKYWTLYVLNSAEATHCCEITPSYWLVAYDFATEKQIDDELRSDLQGELYESACYVHCSSIDKMMKTGFAEELTPDKGRTWDDMDEVEEYLRGNQTYPKSLSAALPPYEDGE
jgi:hypothetical protein